MATTKRQTAIRFDAETEQMIAALAERQRSTATRVITDAVRYYYQAEAARYAEADAENAEIARLTAGLSEQHKMFLFVGLPMRADADSFDVERYLINEWRRPLAPADMQEFCRSFVAAYAPV